MGSRSRTWFDSDMLLAGERLVRSATARLQTAAPPHWWEGELILTSDRLFFLPFAEHPLLPDAAFWLDDVAECAANGRNRFRIAAAEVDATFELTGATPLAAFGRNCAGWLRDVERLREAARPRESLEGRRAAG